MKVPGIDYFSREHPLRRPASSISLAVRHKMFDFFMQVMRPGPEDTVLDVGVTPDQELPESNYFEELYPYKNQLVASSFEDASFLKDKYPGLLFVKTGKKGLPFKDKSFDFVFCSAVLEHAGAQKDQRELVLELLRVGRSFFITTPNRWFPVDFHTLFPFLHWLPQAAHQRALRLLGKHFWACTENLNLLSAATITTLLPDRVSFRIKKQRLLGLSSNLIIYGNT